MRWRNLANPPDRLSRAPRVIAGANAVPQLAGVDTATQVAFDQRARDALEARVAAVTHRSTTDFEIAVDSVSAHAGILSQAEQVDAGLVVVGPGAVADRVARYAPCP